MALYVSEFTNFMNDWLEKNPAELTVQREGRAQWWDKPQSLSAQAEAQADQVPTSPYYYQSNNHD